jgi:uncharacterized protein (TIGR00255 family)
MRSMTGFGAGSAPLGSGRVAVEIRALNHKHQEVRVRVPAELHEHSFYLEQLARDRLGRGRFDVAVRVDGTLNSLPRIDTDRLRQLYSSLTQLARELDPDASVDIAHLLQLPDMVKMGGPATEDARSAIASALHQGMNALTAMQEVEGATLKDDLQQRLKHLTELSHQVSDGSSDLVQYRRQKLKERLDQLLADGPSLPQDRLEHEVALLADRSDITEELVRLNSHFEQFSALLADPEQVGRRLDFLLQEVSREVNTIGAKSPHTKVAQLIVEMKSEVERLREQVQNVA